MREINPFLREGPDVVVEVEVSAFGLTVCRGPRGYWIAETGDAENYTVGFTSPDDLRLLLDGLDRLVAQVDDNG